MRKFFLAFLVVTFFAVGAFATTISKIEITGNKRIEENTVHSFLSIKEGEEYDKIKIDESLKKLHNTGLFSKVDIDLVGNKLIVILTEHPIINKITFEGNNRVKDDDIKGELLLKSRTVYTQAKLKNDVDRILDIYSKEGRFATQVNPKIIRLEDNRVNLIFEITEGPKALIDRINFVGNHVFKDNKLKSIINTKETAWYRVFTSADKYDVDRIEYDRELLRRFYNNMGYADFKVISAIADLTPDKEKFFLTIAVEEGPKYRFGEVNLNMKIETLDSKILLKEIIVEEGDLFNSEKVEDSVSNITKILSDHGYAFVNIDPVYKRNAEKKTIDIDFVIKETSKIYINRININGNVRTKDEVIRRELRISEGDPYSASKLKRSEQRVRDLDFFEKVLFNTVRTDEADKVNIDIHVLEKSTGDINFGAGYSTTDGALVKIGVKERNLLGTGQEISTSFEKAQKKANFQVSYTEPYFMDRNLSFGVDAYNIAKDNKNSSSYSSETNGFSLRFGYELTEYLNHNFNYSMNETNIHNVSTSSRSIAEQAGRITDSGVGHNLSYDRRNSKMFPTDGYYMRFGQELTGLGGDSRYLRTTARGSYFQPVWKENDIVLKFSLSGGHIFGHSKDDKRGIRIFERFFLGGDDLKGFKIAGVGPRDHAGNKDALGANSYYLFNTELSFPLGLPEELDISGAMFFDAGGLFGLDDKTPTILGRHDGLRASAGVGVVWITRVGPFRLDWARPLVKYSYDRTQSLRFSFSTGF